jgi:hypothetical protein
MGDKTAAPCEVIAHNSASEHCLSGMSGVMMRKDAPRRTSPCADALAATSDANVSMWPRDDATSKAWGQTKERADVQELLTTT